MIYAPAHSLIVTILRCLSLAFVEDRREDVLHDHTPFFAMVIYVPIASANPGLHG
jgi:hypothetical protein